MAPDHLIFRIYNTTQLQEGLWKINDTFDLTFDVIGDTVANENAVWILKISGWISEISGETEILPSPNGGQGPGIALLGAD